MNWDGKAPCINAITVITVDYGDSLLNALNLPHQPLHHPPELRWRVTRNHLDIANPCPPQRFLFDRVARNLPIEGPWPARSMLLRC